MSVLLWGRNLSIENYLAAVGDKDLIGLVLPGNRAADVEPVQAIARRAGLPCYVQPFRKDEKAYAAFVRTIRQLGADIFLVTGYSMILDETVLASAKHGVFNVHGALLPQYRGGNVLNWVIINGETETGVTIHVMDAGIDTGPIVAQRRLPIALDDTAVTLRDKLFEVTGSLLAQTMPRIVAGEMTLRPQDESKARYWPRRKAEDGRIDWSWRAERIYNLIRALVKPWPGAFYDDGSGQRVVIDELMPLDEVSRLKDRFNRD